MSAGARIRLCESGKLGWVELEDARQALAEHPRCERLYLCRLCGLYHLTRQAFDRERRRRGRV